MGCEQLMQCLTHLKSSLIGFFSSVKRWEIQLELYKLDQLGIKK